MAAAKPDPIDIPYIGRTGRPFHRMPESQQRWYTQALTDMKDVTELSMYFESIEERVRYYQSERIDIRNRSVKMLAFSEGTPIEDRKARLEEVNSLRDLYVQYLENIVALKATVVTITPGEPLVLPPII